MKTEEFRDIPSYEGLYQVSNLGRVKSFKCGKEKMLKPSAVSQGYMSVGLSINGVKKTKKVHQLVAMAFLNHIPCGFELVVNHIDFDRTNNNVSNLEIVTQRENTNQKHLKSTSKYVGVHWSKLKKKWCSKIKVNGKGKRLGLFDTEIEASEYYENALYNISNNLPIIVKDCGFTSKYKGVSLIKQTKKWASFIWVNGKNRRLGTFNTELEAHNAYQKALKKYENRS